MIHYFLEGELPNNYVNTWKQHVGNCEIKRWNISNLPLDDFPELKPLVEEKKYCALSDFIRLWAVYSYGGIYLDYDIELISNIENLFKLKSFVCIEGLPIWVNAAVSGGHKGNLHHLDMLNNYLNVIKGNKKYDAPLELACALHPLTEYVESKKGDKLDNTDLFRVKRYGDFYTLPKEYFYPYNWNEEFTEECITSKTIGIHRWGMSWVSQT